LTHFGFRRTVPLMGNSIPTNNYSTALSPSGLLLEGTGNLPRIIC
jgi:hypothetical protein